MNEVSPTQLEILRWLAGVRGSESSGVVRVGIDLSCWFKRIVDGKVRGGWTLDKYDVAFLVGKGYIALDDDPEIRTGIITEAGCAVVEAMKAA